MPDARFPSSVVATAFAAARSLPALAVRPTLQAFDRCYLSAYNPPSVAFRQSYARIGPNRIGSDPFFT